MYPSNSTCAPLTKTETDVIFAKFVDGNNRTRAYRIGRMEC
jgi:hypothetical protein